MPLLEVKTEADEGQTANSAAVEVHEVPSAGNGIIVLSAGGDEDKQPLSGTTNGQAHETHL